MIPKHLSDKLDHCHKYLNVKTRSVDFSIMKLAEELNELSSVLIKYVNKPNKREALETNIAEEMGDVYVRMMLVGKHFNNEKEVVQKISSKIHRLCDGHLR